jgi:hypothetical protein
MVPPARRVAPAVLLALGVGLAAPAQAQDRRQFRNLELTDGRTLTAEILATEPTGLMLRSPQGDSLISFEILRDMQPTDELTYKAQPDWLVYVDLPERLEGTALQLLEAIDGVTAVPVGQTMGQLTPSQAADANACDGNIGCIADAVSGHRWMWILSAPDDDTSVIKSGLSSGGQRRSTPLEAETRDALWTSLHQAIGLQAPNSSAPKPPKDGPKGGGGGATFTKQKVAATSLIPVPGLPSLLMGDGGNAALAWGLALPAAGGFVGASLAATPDAPGEGAALMGGGIYLSILFANQVTGMRSLKAQGVVVTPMPMEQGGGLVVAGALP